MKRSIITTFMAAFTLMQTAHAQSISDLPDFGDIEGTTQQLPALPQQTTTVQAQFAGSVSISEMSRKSGGTLYKVELKQALSLLRLDIRVTKSRLKILQATLITDAGQKVDVRQFNNTDVLATDSLNSSESLNQSDRIAAIEILAEAYGGEADIMLTAVADREVPKLVLKTQAVPPAPPAPPKVPTNPGRPDRYEPPTSTRAASHQRRLREGDQVIVMDREYARAVVVGFDNGGKHIIRFMTGVLAGQIGDNWSRESLSVMSGCTSEYCVGDVVYNKEKGEAQVRIAAVQYRGTVIIEFLDGALAGRLGGNWGSDDLTSTARCTKKACVGEKLYLYAENRDPSVVQIIGIDKAGKYTVYFHDGPLAGRRGSKWEDENLAKMSGCGANFCVGEVVSNITRNFLKVQIVAVQGNGRYILKFLEGNVAGRLGANWEDSDLRKFRY